jgi:hypothetical protein
VFCEPCTTAFMPFQSLVSRLRKVFDSLPVIVSQQYDVLTDITQLLGACLISPILWRQTRFSCYRARSAGLKLRRKVWMSC